MSMIQLSVGRAGNLFEIHPKDTEVSFACLDLANKMVMLRFYSIHLDREAMKRACLIHLSKGVKMMA